MEIGIVTLFPELFECLSHGVVGRAMTAGRLTVTPWQLRDFTEDRHHTVDDRPYGGGPGMVLKVDPLQKAVQAFQVKLGGSAKVIYTSPQGKRFTAEAAKRLALEPALILVAGRYEGVDERFVDAVVDEEWSIGDYVLSGGELPACVMIDAIARFIPGVLGDEQSSEMDSYSAGLLDCPHYTRPEVFEGVVIPEVLRSGDHEAIARWREKQSLGRTWLRRPDLLANLILSSKQQALLEEFIREQGEKDEHS